MLLTVVTLVVSSPALLGQQPIPIELSELPSPPKQIGALIQSHQVTFEAGERAASSSESASSRLSAETHFQVQYSYHCRSRWKIDPDTGKLVVSMRFSRIKWQPKHRVWFRRPPAADRFWSDPLVMHELDHVRISGDPRMAARFKELLDSRSTLVRSIDSTTKVNRAYVDRLVDQHVTELFAEITELISIRYRELDRVTGHGRRSLPADSVVHQWLRPDEPTRDGAAVTGEPLP